MSWSTETLASVQTAITNIISGGGVRSYSINGRSFTRENLSELMELRRQLQQEVARENSTTEFILANTGGGAARQRFSGFWP